MNILQKFSTLKHLNKNSRLYKSTVILILILILVLVSVLSIIYGSVKINISQFFEAIIKNDVNSSSYQIINYVRLPRTLAAMLCGIALSISGVILQTIMNNPLAGPNIIGVNAGAGLFSLIIIVLLPEYFSFVPLAAFLGALITTCLIFLISLKTGASRIAIILSGIAISSFLSAGIDTLITLFPDSVVGASSFMIGSFSGVTMENLSLSCFYILIGAALAFILAPYLNILSLGDEVSQSLGIRVKLYRFIFICIASSLAGSAVSFAGLLGFVGLIVPHAARFFVGEDNRFLIPVSALMGASFVILCDLLARTLFSPYEIPVGIIMSFLGGPFFIKLLLKQRRIKYD